jgi:hypothetical protein
VLAADTDGQLGPGGAAALDGVIGIVSRRDILKAMVRDDAVLTADGWTSTPADAACGRPPPTASSPSPAGSRTSNSAGSSPYWPEPCLGLPGAGAGPARR